MGLEKGVGREAVYVYYLGRLLDVDVTVKETDMRRKLAYMVAVVAAVVALQWAVPSADSAAVQESAAAKACPSATSCPAETQAACPTDKASCPVGNSATTGEQPADKSCCPSSVKKV
jgi:hypothetical protein